MGKGLVKGERVRGRVNVKGWLAMNDKGCEVCVKGLGKRERERERERERVE